MLACICNTYIHIYMWGRRIHTKPWLTYIHTDIRSCIDTQM